MLEQRGADNKNHVVCYASRRCSQAESKLGPTDGELLAIVFAVEKFHPYVAGTKFNVVTDHAALVFLQEGKNKNPKLARMAMRLLCYDFTVQHRAGRVHNNADGLSRARTAPTPDTPADDVIATMATTTPDYTPLADAFEVFELDVDIHGESHHHVLEATPPAAPLLGPR